MAAEQRIFKQDGYVEVGSGDGSPAKSITYHPQLNVIILFDSNNHVKIMDIHSGVILQTYNLNGTDDPQASSSEGGVSTISGRFLPLQEKMLFWDGQKLGFRSDYNGVFLLDTILQTPIQHNDDMIRLEMLLAEANILYTCVKDLEHEGLECPTDVANELLMRIKNAQLNPKKSIKAQRWTTICLDVSFASLKLLASNMVNVLRRLERHIPALAIASAINERLTDLMAGGRLPDVTSWPGTNFPRVLMHSEAVRRQTFEKWPHMDYKWALPDQMAQAGFYHQPSSSGEDRAMCFTCSVCLVCWEKTDEPWGEHERHSPMCPFVKGEYTQNVPLTLTYATSPAVMVNGTGAMGFDVISNSDYANVLCTSSSRTGEIIVWSIERHLKQMHSFNLAAIMREICDDGGYEWARVTSICVLPNARAKYKLATMAVPLTGSHAGDARLPAASASTINAPQAMTSTSTLRAGVVDSKIVLGLSIQHSSGEHQLRLVVLNVVESDRLSEGSNVGSLKNQNAVENEDGSKNTIGGTGADDGCDHPPMDDDENEDDDMPPPLSVPPVFAKYADGFDSNGFVSDMLSMKKTIEGAIDLEGGNSFADKNDETSDSMLNNLLQIQSMYELNGLMQQQASVIGGGGPISTGGGSGVGAPTVKSICISTDLNTKSMTADEFKEKILAAAKDKINAFKMNNKINMGVEMNNNTNGPDADNVQLIQQQMSNNINNNNNDNASLSNMSDVSFKMTVSEEIDCVIESCTTVQRTNALASTTSSSPGLELASQSSSFSGNDETVGVRSCVGGIKEREIIEIAEIMPTNSSCNQLLVKLLKTKAPPAATSKIIMANVDVLEDDEQIDLDDGGNGDSVAAQLLLFDCVNSVISTEYSVGMTFSRDKCPQQVCLLPHFQIDTSSANANIGDASDAIVANKGVVDNNAAQEGALAVVCADGTIEVYSLIDFQPITTIAENCEHFVSVAYCRNLERMCACTRNGALFFYSLSAEAENEFGEEILEMDEECQAANMLNLQQSDVSVTDGKNIDESAATAKSNVDEQKPSLSDKKIEKKYICIDCSIGTVSATTTVDCSGGGSSSGTSTSVGSQQPQLSPSPSPAGQFSATNLLAYKSSELTLEDLRSLHSLTLFDENMAMFTAEVPSCWNDLVQAQKQRKPSQPMRPGDDIQYVKTWRLHNDATTWDEHIIELSLTQPLCVGHIDLKFSLFQQCHSPTAIQVTLLKQNANNFGYRMKGGNPHINFKLNAVDEKASTSGASTSDSAGTAGAQRVEMDPLGASGASGGSSSGSNSTTPENPVISEEYLQTHNAEVLAGPIELSGCIDLSETGGTVTLTSPKLLKTRTRNFLIHIKTMGDPAREGQCKTRVASAPDGPDRKRPNKNIHINNNTEKSFVVNPHNIPLPKYQTIPFPKNWPYFEQYMASPEDPMYPNMTEFPSSILPNPNAPPQSFMANNQQAVHMAKMNLKTNKKSPKAIITVQSTTNPNQKFKVFYKPKVSDASKKQIVQKIKSTLLNSFDDTSQYGSSYPSQYGSWGNPYIPHNQEYLDFETFDQYVKNNEDCLEFHSPDHTSNSSFGHGLKHQNKQEYEDCEGCDWLHEISIAVRGVKQQQRLPNERVQRIAMLESNLLLENLFRIVSNPQSTILCRNLALDILNWICFIRLNRFRSPKSERIKSQINKSTAGSNPDLLAQQFECISLSEKYLKDTIRYCIIRSDRFMAHKCVKLIFALTEGASNLPSEVQKHCTIEVSLRKALASTFRDLPYAKYASAVRWFSLLAGSTSTQESQGPISELCVNLLGAILEETNKRWEPYGALLGTRFGLYGFPFEPEIFDYDLPNVNNKSTFMTSSLVNIMRSGTAMHTANAELKKLCSIDGVDFRTFPQLIRCKTVSNQLRGLLEVQQLHFSCVVASEATRIDNLDNVSQNGSNAGVTGSGPSMVNVDDLIMMQPLQQADGPKDGETTEKLYDFVNNVENALTDKYLKNTKKFDASVSMHSLLEPNGIGGGAFDPQSQSVTQFIISPPTGGVLSKSSKNTVTSFVNSVSGANKASGSTSNSSMQTMPEATAKVTAASSSGSSSLANASGKTSQQPKKKQHTIESAEDESTMSSNSATTSGCGRNSADATAATSHNTTGGDNSNANQTNVFAWHKLLSPPSKQVIVIDRMHSGARRFVVLDFGSPVLLTDVVIPMCEELASLQIDIWCFDEESDGVRLVAATDIGNKNLVLSDIQPPPICRFMKVTIIGRVGLSSTKCKIPIGSFYGHVVVLENDSYGDQMHECMNNSKHNIQAQIKALNTLYEDVHCRYSLASCKLMELLTPILNCEMSNLAHMQAFINKQRDEESNNMISVSSSNAVENAKVLGVYEECIVLQQQVNTIRNVVRRLELYLDDGEVNRDFPKSIENALRMASRDKLRILGQNLVEIMLHFSIEYGVKNIVHMHHLFTLEFAQSLFHALVVNGDAHIQLATCSLMVRMCCFQKWWGDFLMDIFCNLFSSQNSKIFAQDRIFFLLTYLGRRSIAMGTCRSNVIDSVMKTLAKLLAPMSLHYGLYTDMDAAAGDDGIWAKADLQLITWLLLFVSVCLDDNTELKDKSANRWDFMSCETDFTKARSQSHNMGGKNLRCFKKRIIQNNKYAGNVQPYTDWGKKILMIQNEHPTIFMELTNKSKNSKQSKPSTTTQAKAPKEVPTDTESNFDKGLKMIRLDNILIVIRGLIALLLEMDFTCNMDQFLLTCKIIARLVSACRPTVQLSKIITTAQLEQLVRLAVWNDQQQPWAVHAITCLLQDLLDADKQFKDNDSTPTNDSARPMEVAQESNSVFPDYSSTLYMLHSMNSMPANNNNNTMNMNTKNTDINQYVDGGSNKYTYLPSLIECDDTEFNEEFNEMHDISEYIERAKPLPSSKRDSPAQFNKNIFNYYCKSVSSAMDSRLDVNLDLNAEIDLRRLTALSSLDMYASLPQIFANEFTSPTTDVSHWPEYIHNVWSGPEYDGGQNTYLMFKEVFDGIFSGLHLEDTWVHLEQVLQMWLTLNGELAEKPYSAGIGQGDVPTIPFGASAVVGLLLALTWHNDIKLRTWCLGFQCLFLACNSQSLGEDDIHTTRIHEVIVNDENFEKMLMRFFSGYGMSSPIITNRCAGPTICKHLHELLLSLHKKSEVTSGGVITWRRKLKDTLLHVVLQLVQPGGAICNQQGPIDAQSQLVRDLLYMPNEKADLNVCINIIECVSFLVYNNISNGDKWQCQRNGDPINTANTFSSLFANVLGSETVKNNSPISENSLIISLLKLSSSLAQLELPRQPSEVTIPENEELITESQTDETKAEQLNIEGHRVNPLIVDTVLRHFPTMKRLLGALSNCSSSSITIIASSVYTGKPTYLLEEPLSTADAVFNLLLILSDKASNPRLIVAPLCQYLEASTCTSQRGGLPRLQLSEPLLWFMSKVLEMPAAVQIFTQLGGIQIICQNLVKLKKSLINMQPGLISLIMQHMTKHSRFKLNAQLVNNVNAKKTTATTTQQQRHLQEGLINFAPFCSITSESETAQSANILIMNPVASHRRPRAPAWSYTFYPNESHMELTITLPTAILLKEIQLTPHGPSLATCPSAVALEISRDYGLGPIPLSAPMMTTGMTLIRLKLGKPEIATSLVLRLYRPKDSSNIGLSQISILGNTIFASQSSCAAGSSSSSSNTTMTSLFDRSGNASEQDTIARSSVGWVRILSRCFHAAALTSDVKLTADVIGTCSSYPGFVETCCSLMNIIPIMPNGSLNNLQSVMVLLGEYNKDLNLSMIKTLLHNTIPQTYKLTNDSICDLLYELSTLSDRYTRDKMQVLIDWVCRLRYTFSNGNTGTGVRCNNPQSGFVKCIASILWAVHTNPSICSDTQILNLQELISQEVYDACIYWLDLFDTDEPLKVAFDSLLCSLCSIKPSLFHQLLAKVNVKMKRPSVETSNATPSDMENARGNDASALPSTSYTDDDKNSGNVGIAPDDSLMALLNRPVFLRTLAMASQSLAAVSILVDSGLPKLLANALSQFCIEFQTKTDGPATSVPTLDDRESKSMDLGHVPKILDFFSECCAEGSMRNWLGTRQGSVFWKPLLELLCNSRPMQMINFAPDAEPRQQAFIRMERATINFFNRATVCYPTNQKTLAKLLIEVIGKVPIPLDEWGNPDIQPNFESARNSAVGGSISGFTRQMILQFLLENERILVSVHSSQPLQPPVSGVGSGNVGGGGSSIGMTGCLGSLNSGPFQAFSGTCASQSNISANAVTVAPVNHHPAKRIGDHHMLFSVSVNAKCQDILQHCISEALTATTPINPSSSNGTAHMHHQAGASGGVSDLKSADGASSAGGSSGLYSNCPLYAFSSFGGGGMEMASSVAAGVTAKDKRIKEAKNQTVSSAKDDSFPSSEYRGIFNMEGFGSQSNVSSLSACAQFMHPLYPQLTIPNESTISQVLGALYTRGHSLATPCLRLNLVASKNTIMDELDEDRTVNAFVVEPLITPLQHFANYGGLSLLAQYLPTVYPDMVSRKPSTVLIEKEKSPPMADWVKIESNEEIYEDLEDPLTEPTGKQTHIAPVPQHSLAAFGLFLRLPMYSGMLLRDKMRAQCLLRLVLGVASDGEGNDIYSLPLAASLPTLPFEVFRQLLDSTPLKHRDGIRLREMVVDVGAMHLVLNCLGVFTHQSHNSQMSNSQTEATTTVFKAASNEDATVAAPANVISDDKSHVYWAKGTGFGTGSTAQSWNVEQALMRQKSEEEHVTILLQVLSSYINPGENPQMLIMDTDSNNEAYSDLVEEPELPQQFHALLEKSCLIPALSSYLRNDSVLDITRHIPLYRAILQLLRALALSSEMVGLLQPQVNLYGEATSSLSISALLMNLKTCVDTYAKRLKVNKKSNLKGHTNQVVVNIDDGDDEGLALLIPDIHETTELVQQHTKADELATQQRREQLGEDAGNSVVLERFVPQTKSVEQRYLELMKKLQFDTYDMIVEADNNGFRFVVPYHFEKMVRMCNDRYHPSRVKRLAQEAVTLSTSLPLSFSSSVFVRCDTDRLDIMKVLITGPADTPYANGCFEFDVFFPPDYPTLPMMINLETTGRHSVRFNPNLYNDGKVCLSVLNTWHGRPEEKWNAQTSSFLQVLVSIQSLILVPEPYFNEPGFERSRGTPSGTISSREYNSNIYQACVRWAMLEQIRNPSPCFKDVIHKHFWLKRDEVCDQIENWIEELNLPSYSERNNRTISFNSMVLRRQYRHLREELAKLSPPEGLEDLDKPFDPTVNLPPSLTSAPSFNSITTPVAPVVAALSESYNEADNQMLPSLVSTHSTNDIPILKSSATTTKTTSTSHNITHHIGSTSGAAHRLKSNHQTVNAKGGQGGGGGGGPGRGHVDEVRENGVEDKEEEGAKYVNANISVEQAANINTFDQQQPHILQHGTMPSVNPNETTKSSAATTTTSVIPMLVQVVNTADEMNDSTVFLPPVPSPVTATVTTVIADTSPQSQQQQHEHAKKLTASEELHVDDAMNDDSNEEPEESMQID